LKIVERGQWTEPNAGLRIAVLGATADQLGFDTRGAGSIASLVVAVADAPLGSPVTEPLLRALAESELAIVCFGPEGFSPGARHACLLALHLTGRMPIVVLSADAADLEPVRRAVADYAAALGVTGSSAAVVTAAGLPEAVAEAARTGSEQKSAAPFRMWLQAGGDAPSAAVVGMPAAGRARAGLEVVLLPAAVPAVVTRVEQISDGQVRVHLDRPLLPRPGDVLAAADARPEVADQVAAHIVWTGAHPLLPGRSYALRLGGQSATAQVGALKHRIDPAGLDPIAARTLERSDVGLCNIGFSTALVFDQAAASLGYAPATGRFTLEDSSTGRVLGFGRIDFTLRRATNIHWQALAVDKLARAHLKGQRPCCLWFTGLSGSGKSTLASLLEKRLNSLGRHTYTLDGDNVRHGLNRDLGFTEADRVENIRRVAEVAKLFVDAGLIVMVSFISPFRAERELARALHTDGEFIEIHVDTPIEVCERRDPKGLYRKARAGQLKNFTGIDSPYEAPERPELRLDSGEAAPGALVEQVLRELARRGMI
jgi:bifunctional enzyme CysN/CysC